MFDIIDAQYNAEITLLIFTAFRTPDVKTYIMIHL